MSKRKPNKTGKTVGGPPIINEARLRSTNSQIGNAAQIVGSPGAVVNQSHTTQVQTSLGLNRTDLIVSILLVFAVVTVASRATISPGLPPVVGQLVAGAALAGIVWKFFERVEAMLTDDAKLEIAIWLLGRKKFGPKIQPWPRTLIKVFNQWMGPKHLSWRCFGWSCGISLMIYSGLFVWKLFSGHLEFYSRRLHSEVSSLETLGDYLQARDRFGWLSRLIYRWEEFTPLDLLPLFLIIVVVGDYASLLATRYALRLIRGEKRLSVSGALSFDIGVTCAIAWIICGLNSTFATAWKNANEWDFLRSRFAADSLISFWWKMLGNSIQSFYNPRSWYGIRLQDALQLWFFPAFFSCVWTISYAGSGFLLKFARRFDLGFQWFNSKFDIEKKPLSAIGLVAGSLVALLYWSWATFRHFVPT